MKSYKLLPIISFFIFSFTIPFAAAQKDSKQKGIEKPENAISGKSHFDNVKTREPFSLPKVNPEERAFVPIVLIESQDKQEFKIEYSDFEPLEKDLAKKYEDNPEKDSITKPQQTYIKLGFGNYLSPFLEAGISNKKQSKQVLGFRLHHKSSLQGPVDKGNSANSVTQVQVNTKHFFDESSLSSKLSYQHDIVHFYGYLPDLDTSIDAKDIAQTFNTFNLALNYGNIDITETLRYQARLNTHYFFNKYGAKELEVNPELDLKYMLNTRNNAYFGFNFGLSFSSYKDIGLQKSVDSKRYLAWTSPFFEKRINNLRMKLGTHITYNNDSIQSKKQIFFYPNISANYALLKGKMEVYTSFKGAMERVLLKDLVQKNPYAQAQLDIFHQDKKWQGVLGLKTKIGKEAYINFNFSQGKYAHSFLWVNDSQDRSRFNLLYEDFDKTTLTLEFAWEHEPLKVLFSSQVSKYTMQNSEFAWHRPTFVNTLSLNYTLKTKDLVLNLDVQHLGGIRTKDFSEDSIHILNDIIDLSLLVDYRFSASKWGMFLQANNLLSQTYQRYLYYNSKQINFIAGVSYSF